MSSPQKKKAKKSSKTSKLTTVSKRTEAWEAAYDARFAQSQFGDDAIGLFALGLQFNLDDLDSIGAESILGGGNDKKCDLLYLDREEGRCVIAQCYFSRRPRSEARANKASDLNTAVTWLLSAPLSKVPPVLKGSAAELRNAIKDDDLSEIIIWYVHNCPESKNVANEMEAVEHTAASAIARLNSTARVQILAKEFGQTQFAKLYRASGSPILVNADIKTTVPKGYEIKGSDWSAYQTYVPGVLIYDLYSTHKTDLFSANVRDYLGSRETDANINNGIKETAANDPGNFWVYNNGVTALVNGLVPSEQTDGSVHLTIKGISIVNGAQTTGAIGSLEKRPHAKLMVPIRFIWTSNQDRVQEIIRFNNSQNKISASDFRSTDAVQKRLKSEFDRVPDAEYEGGRRGGASDTIKRRPNLLPSYTVGQALAAFHGDPVVAYDRKSEIWISDQIYSTYFKDETSAKHIVFAYSLFKTVGNKKLDLVNKQKAEVDLTRTEAEQLAFFDKKGSIPLVCGAVADCLEAVLGHAVPNKFRLSFGRSVSPAEAEQYWSELCNPLFPLIGNLDSAFSTDRITTELTKKAIPQFRNVVQSVSKPNKETFKQFSDHVEID